MHQFGGIWTQEKLKCLRAYLEAYKLVLKRQSFTLVYVDAFAGTGQIQHQKEEALAAQLPLELDEVEIVEKYCGGSAREALGLRSPFDRYIFVDRKAEHLSELRETVKEFPELLPRIEMEESDANDFLLRFCAETDWRRTRAVLFLDPYGLQVDWRTIEAVAKTQAIDTWILFPHAIGVNRLLRRDGNIPESWCARLNRFFGTEEWRDRFYGVKTEDYLFGMPEESSSKTASLDAIVAFYNERLRSVFAGVLERPLILRRETGTPLYALCFACGSPAGSKPALRIAGHIVGK